MLSGAADRQQEPGTQVARGQRAVGRSSVRPLPPEPHRRVRALARCRLAQGTVSSLGSPSLC